MLSNLYYALRYLRWRIAVRKQIKRGSLARGQAVIHWRRIGSGPNLVLLHGGLSSSLDWFCQLPALARRFDVLLIDSRGHGCSTLGDQELSYRLMAGDVAAVLVSLNIHRAHVAGWSDGANVGLLLASDYPQCIDRLIAISANYHPDGIKRVARASAHAPRRLSRWFYRFTAAQSQHWPAVHHRVTTLWANYPQLTTADLQAITAPCLLVVGANDLIELRHSRTMARHMPHTELVIIADAGHSVLRHAPRKMLRLMQTFLAAENTPDAHRKQYKSVKE